MYPQAGTWLYDRAYWCPGYLQIPDEYLLPLVQQSNTIDINMEPYRVSKTEAVENITAYIIQYKKAALPYDAVITDIAAPTNKQIHLRKNPVCNQPVITIANNGLHELKQLRITYGTRGFAKKSFNWKGNLGYGKTMEIVLPGLIDAVNGENYFTVSLSNPNNHKDAFEQDNSMGTWFTKAPVHGPSLVVVVKTNNQPQHNAYTITNNSGGALFERKFDSTQKNRIFKDTLRLPEGCYNFNLMDTAGDGLEFWANGRGGRGYVRLQDAAGNLVENFLSDFGNSVNYNFTVNKDSLQWTPLNTEASIELFPTRTAGPATLEYFSGQPANVKVQIITDEGQKLVEEHEYKNLKEGSFTYDMSYLPPQRYYVKVFVEGVLKLNKRLRVEAVRRN